MSNATCNGLIASGFFLAQTGKHELHAIRDAQLVKNPE